MRKIKKLIVGALCLSMSLFNVVTVNASETVVVNQSVPGSYSYTVPTSGSYKIEVWGAQGSSYGTRIGGKGGYSCATYKLTAGDTLNYYVGGQTGYSKSGNASGAAAVGQGSSGGGASEVDIGSTPLIVGGGGGGANRDFDGLSGGELVTTGAGGNGGRGGGYTVGANGGLVNCDWAYCTVKPGQVDRFDINSYNVYYARTPGYTEYFGYDSGHYTKELEGFYAYAHSNPGGKVHMFSGWQGVEDSTAIYWDIHWDPGDPDLSDSRGYQGNNVGVPPANIIDSTPNSDVLTWDTSYAYMTDQNGNILDIVTIGEIARGEKGSKSYFWEGTSEYHYIHNCFRYTNTVVLPEGVTKIGIHMWMVTRNESKYEYYSQGAFVDALYGSKSGHGASGGGSYISPGYECKDTSSQIGVQSGNGIVKITKLVSEYKITYDLDGGSVSPANPTKYTDADPDFSLRNPTRVGYKFNGWTGNGQSNQTNMVIRSGTTGDLYFKANWVPYTYEVRVYPNQPSNATNTIIKKR